MKKKLKLRIAKFDRTLVVEQLEIEGKFPRTKHVNPNSVRVEFHSDQISLVKDISDSGTVFGEVFRSNEQRDAYVENIFRWITTEQFTPIIVPIKLKRGDMCLVKNNDVNTWEIRKFITRLSVNSIPKPYTCRYACENLHDASKVTLWDQAKPITKSPSSFLKDGEIYTWESEF